MSFQPSPLDSSVEFRDTDKIDVEWIYGKEQQIYFKECKVTVFVRDKNGKKDNGTVWPERNGQCIIPSGTDLYCFGGQLKVG